VQCVRHDRQVHHLHVRRSTSSMNRPSQNSPQTGKPHVGNPVPSASDDDAQGVETCTRPYRMTPGAQCGVCAGEAPATLNGEHATGLVATQRERDGIVRTSEQSEHPGTAVLARRSVGDARTPGDQSKGGRPRWRGVVGQPGPLGDRTAAPPLTTEYHPRNCPARERAGRYSNFGGTGWT
jgi:hypothetical protein